MKVRVLRKRDFMGHRLVEIDGKVVGAAWGSQTRWGGGVNNWYSFRALGASAHDTTRYTSMRDMIERLPKDLKRIEDANANMRAARRALGL